MAEPTTAAAAAATATTTAGIAVVGAMAGVHPELIIAGLVGGIAAILSMETMPLKQRISSVVVAIMVSGLLGPLIVHAAPRAFPDLLRGVDLGILRHAVGFVLGALAYRVLLPALMRRAQREIEGGDPR